MCKSRIVSFAVTMENLIHEAACIKLKIMSSDIEKYRLVGLPAPKAGTVATSAKKPASKSTAASTRKSARTTSRQLKAAEAHAAGASSDCSSNAAPPSHSKRVHIFYLFLF